MDKRGNANHIRLPSKLENLIEQYSKREGLRKNDAVIHLLARGLHYDQAVRNFHILDYTDDFFKTE